MSNQLNTFIYEGQPLSVINRNGEPWFVANDVGRLLGLPRNGRNSIRYLTDAEKGALTRRTPGGNQRVICVSESGLYALIFKSRKPEAKRFRLWVTSEVLPAIRKTGHYAVQKSTQAAQVPAPAQVSQGQVMLDVSALSPADRLIAHALIERLAQGKGA